MADQNGLGGKLGACFGTRRRTKGGAPRNTQAPRKSAERRSLHYPKACLLLAVWTLAGAGAGISGITWNVTFEDVTGSSGFGFDDPDHGATRRATVQSVLDYLSNDVFDETGTVDFVFKTSETDGSGFLASSGPFFFTGPNGFQNGTLYEHVRDGTDPDPGNEDANAKFDFGRTWNSGMESPAGDEFDLFSVTLHEISHSLGFLSLVDENGNSKISGGDPGVFSVLDSFLELGDGTQLFGVDGEYLGDTGDLTGGDVFFDGPNATAANGGNPVKMYAPSTFSSGSSISHLDTSVTGVMNPGIAPGVEKRSYTSIDLGILQDIGWSIAMPEVSSVTILIPLLGGGACFHRRRIRQRVS